MSNINQSNLENIFESCQHSSSTWLIAHAIYASIVSLAMPIPILLPLSLVDLFRFALYFRDRQLNDDEHRNEVLLSNFEYLGRFGSRKFFYTYLYVLASSICHSLMNDTPISSMMLTRWYIEAILDNTFYAFLINFSFITSMELGCSRFMLNEFSKYLLITMIVSFCCFRYGEFDSQSDFNTFFVDIFRRFCVANHYFHLNNHSIGQFLSELPYILKNVPPLLK